VILSRLQTVVLAKLWQLAVIPPFSLSIQTYTKNVSSRNIVLNYGLCNCSCNIKVLEVIAAASQSQLRLHLSTICHNTKVRSMVVHF